jgi:enoyl-CoA hydratase
MPYRTLLIEIAESIAIITLNRPAVLNALSLELLSELDSAILGLADDPAVRVILVRGAGGRAFAAGADIGELANADAAEGEQLARTAQRVLRRIETLGKPTVACIHGFALGGGCELALACTLRFATPGAHLGQPELKLGIIPGWGGTQRLPRLIGRSAALRLLLTGETISAREALRVGLLDEIVPDAPPATVPDSVSIPVHEVLPPDPTLALMARARAVALEMAAMPPLAVAAALEAVTRGADLGLDDGLALETGLFGRLCATEDKREGTSAFLAKRPPQFRGC